MVLNARVGSIYSIIICAILLYIVFVYISTGWGMEIWFGASNHPQVLFSFTASDPAPQSGWGPDLSAQAVLCSYKSDDDLSSFVWSHRAGVHGEDRGTTANKSPPDASPAALTELLDAGITHFDVDVCYFSNRSNSDITVQSTNADLEIAHDDGDFYIVHPLKAPLDPRRKESVGSEPNAVHVQTLRSFLDQIYKHDNIQHRLRIDAVKSGEESSAWSNAQYAAVSGTRKSAFVTLEPKFLNNAHSSPSERQQADPSPSGGYWVWTAVHTKTARHLLARLLKELDMSKFPRSHVAIIAATLQELKLQEDLLHSIVPAPSDAGSRTTSQQLLIELGADISLLKQDNIVSGYDAVESSQTKPHIAVSMRSRPTRVRADETSFEWHGAPMWPYFTAAASTKTDSASRPIEMDISDIGRAHTVHSSISGITYGNPNGSLLGCSSCCTAVAHYSHRYPQIVMPDVALLQKEWIAVEQQTASQLQQGSAFSSVCARSGTTVIPWVVDSTDLLMQMLQVCTSY